MQIKNRSDIRDEGNIELNDSEPVCVKRFHQVTVGREMEIVKLKEKINFLFEKLRLSKKYEVPGKRKRGR